MSGRQVYARIVNPTNATGTVTTPTNSSSGIKASLSVPTASPLSQNPSNLNRWLCSVHFTVNLLLVFHFCTLIRLEYFICILKVLWCDLNHCMNTRKANDIDSNKQLNNISHYDWNWEHCDWTIQSSTLDILYINFSILAPE